MWLFTPKERMRKTNIVIHSVCQGPRDISKERRNIMTTNPVHQELLTLVCTNIPYKWWLDSSCPLASIYLPKGKPDLKMGEMENPLISGTAFAKRKMQNSTQGKYQCYKPERLLFPRMRTCFFALSLFFWSLSDPKLIGHWRAAETRF